MDIAVFSDSSFGGLLASTWGARGVESAGFLDGEIDIVDGDRFFLVDSVSPVQRAVRNRDSVTPDEEEVRRVKSIVDVIGGYHSHLGKKNYFCLSRWDKDYVRQEYPDGPEVIVNIGKVRSAFPLRVSPTEIEGCKTDRGVTYKISIIARHLEYGRNMDKGHARVVKLEVPHWTLEHYF